MITPRKEELSLKIADRRIRPTILQRYSKLVLNFDNSYWNAFAEREKAFVVEVIFCPHVDLSQKVSPHFSNLPSTTFTTRPFLWQKQKIFTRQLLQSYSKLYKVTWGSRNPPQNSYASSNLYGSSFFKTILPSGSVLALQMVFPFSATKRSRSYECNQQYPVRVFSMPTIVLNIEIT